MKKRKIFILAFYIVITLIFFGNLFKIEYATDTYSVFNFSKEEIYMQYAMLGRFITAIIGKFLKILNISENTMYISSYILGVFFASLSQYKLYTIIKKDVKSKALKIIIPTLIIINPFSIELSLYIEKGIMWLAVLISILAVENIIKFFEINYNTNIEKDKKIKKYKYLIYSILLMFVANCSYQGIVGIFAAISLVYILKYSKNIKQFIINNVIVGLVYGIPAITNYLMVKTLFKASRVNGQIILSESIEKIYLNSKDMIKYMYNLLPKYVFILAILFTFAVFCCKILREKNKLMHITKFLYIIFGTIILAVLPQIMQPTTSIWFVPRSTYCFACTYGILSLYLCINYELKSTAKTMITIIGIIILALQLSKFIQIEKGRYLLNKQDENITMQIIEQIKQYEKKTGNRVTEVAVYSDEKPNYTYSGIFATGDMNVKCYANDWSTVSILEYYLKRNLKHVEKEETIKQEFQKQNWDEFNLEQIKFQQNKLILCNY